MQVRPPAAVRCAVRRWRAGSTADRSRWSMVAVDRLAERRV